MRGCGHSTASAANETSSTIAAAQPKSHSGIGRLARWIRPCACAAAGHTTAAPATTRTAASRRLALDDEDRPVRVRTCVHTTRDQGAVFEAATRVAGRAPVVCEEGRRVRLRAPTRKLVGLDRVAVVVDEDGAAV